MCRPSCDNSANKVSTFTQQTMVFIGNQTLLTKKTAYVFRDTFLVFVTAARVHWLLL